MTEIDTYFISLQFNIINAVAGYKYIFTVDAVSYFHQFNVSKRDRHKLTMISHREQEQFNVALMRYKKSPSYVQRQTDLLLRSLRHNVRAYIDDLIIFFKTLKKHLLHLQQLFALCRDKRICLNPGKSYLKYFFIVLLDQRVNSLKLFTSKEKIATIAVLTFLKSLRELEIFLDMIG